MMVEIFAALMVIALGLPTPCVAALAAMQYPDTVYPTAALRIRAAPSTSAQVLTTIPPDTHAGADLDRPYDADGLTWVPVSYQGVEGWAAAQYLSTKPPRAHPAGWRPAADAGSSAEKKFYGAVAGSVIFYLLPSLIAGLRRHHNALAIFFLNLLAGWTGLGWFIAFIWALTAVRRDAVA